MTALNETITRTRPGLTPVLWTALAALCASDLAGRRTLMAHLSSLPAEVPLPSLAASIGEPSAFISQARLLAPDVAIPEDAVTVALSGDDNQPRIALALPRELVRVLVQQTLRRDFTPLRTISSGETGVLLHALDQVARDLFAASVPRFVIRGALYSPAQIDDYLGRTEAAMSCQLTTDSGAWRVTLLFSSVPSPPAEIPGVVRPDSKMGHWPTIFRLVCGECRLTRGELEMLRVGDLLVPDRLSTPYEPARDGDRSAVLINGKQTLSALWRGAASVEVLVETRYDRAMKSVATYSGTVTPPGDKNSALAPAAESEVCLRIELARVVLPLSEASKLVPGAVISLEKSVANRVELYCEDMRVARGMLVRSGDELAVEIEELS